MEEKRSVRPLRVMQWNTLADGLAREFVRVPASILEWRSRAPKLLSTILEADADIVCLQEVNHYDDYFFPHLQQQGYSGVFVAKTRSPAVKFGYAPDGSAVFFRTSRLLLLEQDVLLYPGPTLNEQKKGGIICRLKDIQANEEFVITTTHLKARDGEENEKMRLVQIQILLEVIATFTEEKALPAVICGDFNTSPLSDGYKVVYEHKLDLRSAYACRSESPPGETGSSDFIQLDTSIGGGFASEPPFTTWKFRPTGEKKETIDYIWFSKDKGLLPYRVRRLPNEASIGWNGLPSESMPSDHLPLVCEFVWKEESCSLAQL